MEVKERQEENASFPIFVTLFGMMIDFKEEQPENTPSPITVTLFGTENLLSFFPAG